MRHTALVVSLVVLLAACGHGSGSQPDLAVAPEVEGDGSSCEQPIVVHAGSDRAATRWEYRWLRHHFPKHGVVGQGLSGRNGRMYDEMRFKTADGKGAFVCFDITRTIGT